MRKSIPIWLRKWQVMLPLLIYFGFYFLGLDGSHLSGSEYKGVMRELIENEASASEVDDNFKLPLRFFMMFSAVGLSPEIVAFLFGGVCIFMMFWRGMGLKSYIYSMVLFSPALFMNLGKPGKEMFLTFFALLVFYCAHDGRWKRAAALFFLYGALFRVYYIPLAILIYYFSAGWRGINKYLWVLLAIMAAAIIVLFSSEIFDFVRALMGRRDFGYLNDEGVRRTVFKNPLENTSWVNLIVNYWYAFFRLNFPILFDATIKDFAFQAYVFILFYIMLRSVLKKDPLGCAVFVNIFMYPFFEPDLGSYVRHVASIFPVYIYMINIIYRQRVRG